LVGRVTRQQPAHDLHQAHHRHRVEEVVFKKCKTLVFALYCLKIDLILIRGLIV
jgi:hypothetical protein